MGPRPWPRASRMGKMSAAVRACPRGPSRRAPWRSPSATRGRSPRSRRWIGSGVIARPTRRSRPRQGPTATAPCDCSWSARTGAREPARATPPRSSTGSSQTPAGAITTRTIPIPQPHRQPHHRPPCSNARWKGSERVDVMLVGPNVRLDPGVTRDVFHAVDVNGCDAVTDDSTEDSTADSSSIELRVAYRVGLYHDLREEDRTRGREEERRRRTRRSTKSTAKITKITKSPPRCPTLFRTSRSRSTRGSGGTNRVSGNRR